jgi:acyl carrier protein
MEPATIRARILELARSELGLQGELPDGDLAEHLDSVQRLTLVVAIEDTFEVVLEPEDEEAVVTLDDVVAVVARALEARHA